MKWAGALRTSQMPESGRRQLADKVGDAGEAAAGLAVEAPACLRVDQRGLEQGPVDVELSLGRGGVPYPDRARAAVAVQLQRAFGCALAAVEAIEDLQARVAELRCVQQPPEESLGLPRATELQQGLESEGRVTDPAEAVVPVALAAYLLGQGGACRCGYRAGGCVEEQLERQRAADHLVAPRTVVGPVRRPVSPVGDRGCQACLDVLSGRKDERLLVRSAQGDHRRAGLLCLETAKDGLVGELRLAGPQEQTASASGPASATGTPPRRSSRGDAAP